MGHGARLGPRTERGARGGQGPVPLRTGHGARVLSVRSTEDGARLGPSSPPVRSTEHGAQSAERGAQPPPGRARSARPVRSTEPRGTPRAQLLSRTEHGARGPAPSRTGHRATTRSPAHAPGAPRTGQGNGRPRRQGTDDGKRRTPALPVVWAVRAGTGRASPAGGGAGVRSARRGAGPWGGRGAGAAGRVSSSRAGLATVRRGTRRGGADGGGGLRRGRGAPPTREVAATRVRR